MSKKLGLPIGLLALASGPPEMHGAKLKPSAPLPLPSRVPPSCVSAQKPKRRSKKQARETSAKVWRRK